VDKKTKALQVIEALCSDVFLSSDRNKIVEQCYRFAHIGGSSCKNPHLDWDEELENLYQALVENGLI